MKERLKTGIRRRDMLAIAVGSAGAALMDAVVSGPANAKSVDLKNKRKARYQAQLRGSPKLLPRQRLSGQITETSMLIKRSQRHPWSRGKIWR